MGDLVRAFVGLELDASSIRTVMQMQAALSETGVVKVTEASLHVTLKFLGDVDLNLVGRGVLRALEPLVQSVAAPSLGKGRLDAFPSAANANVIIVTTEDPSGLLAQLAAHADERAAALGVPRETRPYRPHVTLARCKPALDVRERVARTAPALLGHATRVTLFRSSRSVYTPIDHVEIGQSASK